MSDGAKDGFENLLRDAPASLHSQISEAFRARIASGEWPAHYRLKTEPELAVELGVSRGTLRRALTTLLDEGLLRRVRGRGTYVASAIIEPAIAQRLSTLTEDFVRDGIPTEAIVLDCTLTVPPKPVAALLDLPQEQSALFLARFRRTEAGPVALMENYVRADLTPGIEAIDFSANSLFGTLEDRYRLKISSARRTFSAEAANERVSAALEMQPGAPVQYLQQITYLADGRPVEYSDVWINSNRLRVTSILSRR
ncbi:GntR family transcriptional regulator [Albibacillus kandeliae]|uniref:GntR family transcriptional regulator n=1 Tax=Albibacillus kandeliae TaxID=2174228 RepID=UPI0018E57E13|nr:GntR family transcriptional regulator [Albibacillus kandeliae]